MWPIDRGGIENHIYPEVDVPCKAEQWSLCLHLDKYFSCDGINDVGGSLNFSQSPWDINEISDSPKVGASISKHFGI